MSPGVNFARRARHRPAPTAPAAQCTPALPDARPRAGLAAEARAARGRRGARGAGRGARGAGRARACFLAPAPRATVHATRPLPSARHACGEESLAVSRQLDVSA